MQIMNSAGEYLMMGGEKEEREEEEEEETLLEAALEMATEIRKATKRRTKGRCDLIRASCISAIATRLWERRSLNAPSLTRSINIFNDIVTNILHHSTDRLPGQCYFMWFPSNHLGVQNHRRMKADPSNLREAALESQMQSSYYVCDEHLQTKSSKCPMQWTDLSVVQSPLSGWLVR